MPTIIDKSYFTGKLFIPNVVDVPDIQAGYSSEAPTNQDKLTLSIQKYERLLLVNALGITQYNELIADVEATSGKWYDMINGKTYDNKRFEGLKDIIAYFVYVNFLKYEAVQFNTTGLQRADAENATSVSPVNRMVDYWNEFVNMYQSHEECGCWWWLNYDTNYTFVSLYEFIKDFPDNYDCGYFNFYRIQNSLGI